VTENGESLPAADSSNAVMREITTPALLYTKAALFLLLGALAAALLIARSPSVATAALIAVCVWAFARGYYFLFYVLERYVDASMRYSGVLAMLMRIVRRGDGGQA
jgi:hypothetical protein